MQNRRKFLAQSSLATAALALVKPLQSFSSISQKSFSDFTNVINIYHTNDLHGNFLGSTNALGGLQNIKSTLQNIDKGILLDAGDFIDKNISINNAVQTIEAMNAAGYNAATIGNHDLSNGQQYLFDLCNKMNFAIVNCNYTFSHTGLAEKVKSFSIIKYGRFKVGVTGVGPDLDSSLKNKEKINYHHPYEKANQIASYLKNDLKCDLVICLSHLGNDENKKVNNRDFAINSKNIDVIVGGHGRTMCLEPVVTRNKEDKEIFISQTGWDGLMMRKISFSFMEDKRNKFNVKNYIPGLKDDANLYNEFRKMVEV